MEKTNEKKTNILEVNCSIFLVSLSEIANKQIINFFTHHGIDVVNKVSKKKMVFAGNPIFCPDVFLNYVNGKNKFIYVNSDMSEWVNYTVKNKPLKNKYIKTFICDYDKQSLEMVFAEHQKNVIRYIPQNNLLISNIDDDMQTLLDFLSYRTY